MIKFQYLNFGGTEIFGTKDPSYFAYEYTEKKTVEIEEGEKSVLGEPTPQCVCFPTPGCIAAYPIALLILTLGSRMMKSVLLMASLPHGTATSFLYEYCLGLRMSPTG